MRENVLLVIVADVISEIIKKGEFCPNYYNPGNFFDEVHIIAIGDDTPNMEQLQSTVGTARLRFHSISAAGKGVFIKSLGFRPCLLRSWARPAVELARQINPCLIRCYGHFLNAFVAYEIKRVLNIPYIVSLHGNPDVDYYRGRLATSLTKKIYGIASKSYERLSIRNADFVIPVYSPIIPYLENLKIRNFAIVYNVVGQACKQKLTYEIDTNKVKLLCVGRQQNLQKDPRPIIDAVASIENIFLTLIGDGDLHEVLVSHVYKLGIENRVSFIKSMENAAVLSEMSKSDIYVYSSINYEISKTTMEAALCGLPIIVNNRNNHPAQELLGGHFYLVDGSADSYKSAIISLISDNLLRSKMGRKAFEHAKNNWAPEKTEASYVEISRLIIRKYNP
jgi:glycosyltransferase involved in cell wall biosynthesis